MPAALASRAVDAVAIWNRTRKRPERGGKDAITFQNGSPMRSASI